MNDHVEAERAIAPRLTIGQCIRGKGLSGPAAAGILVILLVQIVAQFEVARHRTVPQSVQRWYPIGLFGQVEDVVGWIDTGLLLPANAVPVRAPRPLYPFIVTVGKWVGLFSNLSISDRAGTLHRGIQILLATNIALSVASGWLFLAACRRFGLSLLPSLCATILALSGRGFSYWSAQAIPEVLTYFASIACMLAGLIAVETEGAGEGGWRLVGTWSLVGSLIGVFLLGKEMYWLVFMGAVWLGAWRAWKPLVGFLLASLLPTVLWLHYVVRVIHVFKPADYYPHYQFVTWLFTDLLPAPAAVKIQLLGTNLNLQVVSFLEAFVWVPVFFACIGVFARRPLHTKTFLALFGSSQYLMFLALKVMRPRMLFWTWPVVYFFAWCGVEWIAERFFRNSGVAQWSVRLVCLAFLVWLQTQAFNELVLLA